MRAFSIAVPIAGFAVVHVFVKAEPRIHGRSRVELEQVLRDEGVVVSGVEAWGIYIRVYVSDGAGGSTVKVFDPETLQQVEPPLLLGKP
jgi:hypothetical protein